MESCFFVNSGGKRCLIVVGASSRRSVSSWYYSIPEGNL